MNTQLVQTMSGTNPSVYVNSTPNDGRWGQPPASYYLLSVENGVMRGYQINGTQQPMSSNLPENTQVIRAEMLAAMETVLREGSAVWKELANR